MVKQIAALKQKAAEKTVSPQPALPGDDGENKPVGTDIPLPSNPKPEFAPQPQPSKPTYCHFELMTTLDSTRIVKNVGNLMDEVINHLMQVDGSNVEIKLMVEATMPNGTPVTTVRTVTENCKTLKVERFEFNE